MKIVYNWLKDYLETEKTPEEIKDLLTFHVAEVESVQLVGAIDKVVVGKVQEVKPHPNADKLHLTAVDIGGEKPLKIVCGAPNVAVGQLVPVALVGAVLPNGMKIESRAVRGEMSEGMICAEDELGLGKNHESIMILPDDYEIGNAFAPAGGDMVIDVSVPANRPDLMSHLGVARELAALEKKVVIKKEYPMGTGTENILNVQVADPKICPRYSAYVIEGIKVGPSPAWMQKRLAAVGLRPINNVVDLTNYLMYDLGQPLHAFDFDKLAGGQMVVRGAKEGEVVVTLDGQKRSLKQGMPIIQDREKLIDLAGIMGGQNSEVRATTTTIVLQAANFEGIAIRQASRALGHRTDASGIYEKNIDPNLTLPTLAKAFALLQEMSPGIKIRQVIDQSNVKIKPTVLEIEAERINKLLGTSLREEEIVGTFKNLGLLVSGQGRLSVTVPTYRRDLNLPQDLIEEVARYLGYDQISENLPVGKLISPSPNWPLYWERKAKRILTGCGFSEVVNYSFNSQKQIAELGLDLEEYLEVANPISPEQSYMRASLIPNLLDNAKNNLKEFPQFSLFELGRIFYQLQDGRGERTAREQTKLGGVMVNKNREMRQTIRSPLFLKAKGVVELIMHHFGFDEKSRDYVHFGLPSTTFHPGRSAVVRVSQKGEGDLEGEIRDDVGFVGAVHPALLKAFDIKAEVVLFDLDFDKLGRLATEKREIKDVGKFPAVTLDVALVVDRKVLTSEIEKVLGDAGDEMLENIELFDVYEGEKVPSGKKSLAFHLSYRLPDRTLKDQEVRLQHEKILSAVKEKFGAEVR